MKFTDHMVQPFSEIFGFLDEIIHIFWSRTKRAFTTERRSPRGGHRSTALTGVFRMGGKHIYVQSEMFGKGEKKNEHEDPLGQEQVELALKKTRRRPTKRIASFQQDYSEP
jgi:hypothetical protein